VSTLQALLKGEMAARRAIAAEREWRTVDCDTCQGEGRIYRGYGNDERDCGECPDCFGTGRMEIEVAPISEGEV